MTFFLIPYLHLGQFSFHSPLGQAMSVLSPCNPVEIGFQGFGQAPKRGVLGGELLRLRYHFSPVLKPRQGGAILLVNLAPGHYASNYAHPAIQA